jgi:hypothetical protein
MDTIQQIREELEGKKKPFTREGKPVIYGPITGAVYFFNDRSGFAVLKGDIEKVKTAIDEGTIDGTIGYMHNMPVRSPDSESDKNIPAGATLVPLCNGHVYGIAICSGRPEAWQDIFKKDGHTLDLSLL